MLEHRRFHHVLVVEVVDIGRTTLEMADGQRRVRGGVGAQGFFDQSVIGGGSERVHEIDASGHGLARASLALGHQRRCRSLAALKPGRSSAKWARSKSVGSPAMVWAIIRPE